MMIQKFESCPRCNGEDCCVSTPDSGFPSSFSLHSYVCYGCGFETHDMLHIGEFENMAAEADFPALWHELKFIDAAGRVWLPHEVSIAGKGKLYVTERSKDDWGWFACREVFEPTDRDERGVSWGQPVCFGKDYQAACHFIDFRPLNG